MRGCTVVSAGALALLLFGARAARAQFDDDPEESCRTIRVFDDKPTPEALHAALDRAGKHGRTRLDLRVSVEAPPPPSNLGALLEHADSRPPSNLVEVPPDPAASAPPGRWALSPEIARTLVGSPKATKIQALSFAGDLLTAQSVRILARSRSLDAVTSLSLADTGVTAAVLHELLAPGAFPALVTLDLRNNRLRPADLRELAARLAERKIRHLTLGHFADWSDMLPGAPRGSALSRSAPAVEALAQVATNPSLTTLDLGSEPLGFAELEALLMVARQEPLQIVTLTSFAKLSRKQLEALAALDPAGHITLSINDSTTTPSVLRALDRSRLIAKAFALSVTCGDACAQVISRSTNTARLRELEFDCAGDGDARFTHKTADALANAVALGALRKLALRNDVELCQEAGIGVEGLRALLKAPFAGQLESLRLEDQMDDAGYVELAKAETLGALKELDASGWESLLTPRVAPWFFRDGALARHIEVLRFKSEGTADLKDLPPSFDVPKLRVLDLAPLSGSPKEWLRFARQPGLRKLRTLIADPSRTEGTGKGDDETTRALEKNLGPDACVE